VELLELVVFVVLHESELVWTTTFLIFPLVSLNLDHRIFKYNYFTKSTCLNLVLGPRKKNLIYTSCNSKNTMT
jgi:hypothetical protein